MFVKLQTWINNLLGGVVVSELINVPSSRVILQSLSHHDLKSVDVAAFDQLSIKFDSETLDEPAKTTISRKLEQMDEVEPVFHPWYTYWAIIDKESNLCIGFVGFKGYPDDHGFAEVGCDVTPKFKALGLMSETLNLLLDWAKTSEECKGIKALGVLKSNKTSNKVLLSNGFKLIRSTETTNSYVKKFE